MKFCRITAYSRDGGHLYKPCKLVILCALDENHKIIDGKWMGYFDNDGVHWPFILREDGYIFYGGDENYFEPTNIKENHMNVGRLFTVFSSPAEQEQTSGVYEVVNCHIYNT